MGFLTANQSANHHGFPVLQPHHCIGAAPLKTIRLQIRYTFRRADLRMYLCGNLPFSIHTGRTTQNNARLPVRHRIGRGGFRHGLRGHRHIPANIDDGFMPLNGGNIRPG